MKRLTILNVTIISLCVIALIAGVVAILPLQYNNDAPAIALEASVSSDVAFASESTNADPDAGLERALVLEPQENVKSKSEIVWSTVGYTVLGAVGLFLAGVLLITIGSGIAILHIHLKNRRENKKALKNGEILNDDRYQRTSTFEQN